MKRVLLLAVAALALGVTGAKAQYYNNNQALENYYRQEQQRQMQNEQMREQQQFMEQQREQHQRDISRGQLW